MWDKYLEQLIILVYHVRCYYIYIYTWFHGQGHRWFHLPSSSLYRVRSRYSRLRFWWKHFWPRCQSISECEFHRCWGYHLVLWYVYLQSLHCCNGWLLCGTTGCSMTILLWSSRCTSPWILLSAFDRNNLSYVYVVMIVYLCLNYYVWYYDLVLFPDKNIVRKQKLLN